MLVITDDQVDTLLDYPSCIAVIANAQRAFSAGEAVLPVRMTLEIPELHGEMNVMPGSLGKARGLGVKLVTFGEDNAARGLPAVQAVVLLFDPETGAPQVLVAATRLTAIRTAAASAAATDVLARPDASSLALIGAGVQARSHLDAMLAVRPIRSVRVVSKSGQSARRFADEQRIRHPRLDIEASETVEQAVQDAEVICTVSLASDPVLHFAWLQPGSHVNAVGAHSPLARELDSETMLNARVVVDSREANLTECGDCLIPISEGLFGPEHVSDEIGDVLIGIKPGRRSNDEITVYQSCGLAIQDVAAARLVYERVAA